MRILLPLLVIAPLLAACGSAPPPDDANASAAEANAEAMDAADQKAALGALRNEDNQMMDERVQANPYGGEALPPGDKPQP